MKWGGCGFVAVTATVSRHHNLSELLQVSAPPALGCCHPRHRLALPQPAPCTLPQCRATASSQAVHLGGREQQRREPAAERLAPASGSSIQGLAVLKRASSSSAGQEAAALAGAERGWVCHGCLWGRGAQSACPCLLRVAMAIPSWGGRKQGWLWGRVVALV